MNKALFRFSSRYFGVSVGIFVLLVIIAVFLNDKYIRPFVGDVLVVIWMFTFLKAFCRLAYKKLLIVVLGFSFAMELGQFVNVIELIGLQESQLARIVLGTTFDWLDLIAYSLGGGAVWVVVRKFEPLEASEGRISNVKD